MRILHVFPNFKIGGSQVRFAMLAGTLGSDISHTVIAVNGDHTAKQIVPQEAQVSYATVPTTGSLFNRLQSYRKYLREQAPDILITYNWGAIEWALANIVTHIPHIHMEDGFGPEEIRRQLTRRVWTRRLSLFRSTLVVPSMTLRDIATRIWKVDSANVRYIPNGIPPRATYRMPLSALGLGLPEHLPRIAWAGALRPEKNPLRLLQAFAPLRERAVLLILGDGPERGTIMAEAERLSLLPHIRLLGHRDDARDIIMQCDIVALSSDTEQMPFVILEAMDAGLPIASVDVGDVRQMVSAENHPFIVPVNDTALGFALESLLDDPALRVTIGQANKVRLRECYDVQHMTGQYSRLFQSVRAPSNGRLAYV
ncbi:MAG TPA: glycosyltransferase [Rhizomicrobium sp.]|jgi:glycosyltransferase involved in cell wall biosynthesis